MWLALLALLLGADADTRPVDAMILTVKGDATLKRGKTSTRAAAMDLLRRGDELTVGRDGELRIVVLKDGVVERIKAGATVTLGEKGCTPAEQVERLKGKKLKLDNVTSLREMVRGDRGAVGVLRGDKPATPQTVSPLFGTAILSTRPGFAWPAVKGATGYRVDLLEVDGKTTVWSVKTDKPALTFPQAQEALEPGAKHFWQVFALSEGKPKQIVRSRFTVLTKDEVDELTPLAALGKSDEPGDRLLAAVSYEVRMAYGEALALYEKLAADAPDEPNFQTTLANYYDRAGREDLAAAARKKAEKLKKK